MIKTSPRWSTIGSGLGINVADTDSVNAALDAQRERNAIKPETRLSLKNAASLAIWDRINSAYSESTWESGTLVDLLISKFEEDGAYRKASERVLGRV